MTGLMWENKTADGGLHDGNKRYTNYSADYGPENLGLESDASGLVVAVNQQSLCGRSDWRMPSADELQSIVDYGIVSGPRIDSAFFPNTQYAFWSSSPSVRNGFPEAWIVDVGGGGGVHDDGGRDEAWPVRLVRAASESDHYTVSANGQEVQDNTTQLVWRRCPEGMVWSGSTCAGSEAVYNMYDDAFQHAVSEATRTGMAWRLPNIKELASIVDRSRRNPAIDDLAFPATPSESFWSSSPLNGLLGWHVGFYDGNVSASDVSGGWAVRLVRGGQ